MQQCESLQSLAQERREVHEDLPTVSGHLPMDRQDRYTKQSHLQRGRRARMSCTDREHSFRCDREERKLAHRTRGKPE